VLRVNPPTIIAPTFLKDNGKRIKDETDLPPRLTHHRPLLKDKGKRIKDETGKQFSYMTRI
jgi:hypothetical protein